ncbi:TetR/AcrR family transcriptional regulator [Streptomyces sp. NPDC008121]|uniref:TetR/AcrR family transcriptional regulator n=1 Tax=Streptomyces sp. NPDC008121 TaxID=3364809 RepID=UPI0036E3910F
MSTAWNGRRCHARQRLLEAATRRLCSGGVAATGTDTITAGAGVAKMNLFKAAPVRAYLDARHEEWLGPLPGPAGVGGRSAGGAARLRRLRRSRGFRLRGRGLLNAAARPPVGEEGRAVVRAAHKVESERLTADHLEQLMPDRPDEAHGAARHLPSPCRHPAALLDRL